MQHYTMFFIAVNALHVSGGYSAHHQELKLCTQHLVYIKIAATASVGELALCQLTHASSSGKQA